MKSKIFNFVKWLLFGISIATFLEFVEMATDSCGIDSSEGEYVWLFAIVWIATLIMFIFEKKIKSYLQ